MTIFWCFMSSLKSTYYPCVYWLFPVVPERQLRVPHARANAVKEKRSLGQRLRFTDLCNSCLWRFSPNSIASVGERLDYEETTCSNSCLQTMLFVPRMSCVFWQVLVASVKNMLSPHAAELSTPGFVVILGRPSWIISACFLFFWGISTIPICGPVTPVQNLFLLC